MAFQNPTGKPSFVAQAQVVQSLQNRWVLLFDELVRVYIFSSDSSGYDYPALVILNPVNEVVLHMRITRDSVMEKNTETFVRWAVPETSQLWGLTFESTKDAEMIVDHFYREADEANNTLNSKGRPSENTVGESGFPGGSNEFTRKSDWPRNEESSNEGSITELRRRRARSFGSRADYDETENSRDFGDAKPHTFRRNSLATSKPPEIPQTKPPLPISIESRYSNIRAPKLNGSENMADRPLIEGMISMKPDICNHNGKLRVKRNINKVPFLHFFSIVRTSHIVFYILNDNVPSTIEHQSIPLNDCMADASIDPTADENTFYISAGNGDTFILQVSSPDEVQKWIKAIFLAGAKLSARTLDTKQAIRVNNDKLKALLLEIQECQRSMDNIRVSDPNIAQDIDRTWEKLSLTRFQILCYIAILEEKDMPSPRGLFSSLSKATKKRLHSLGGMSIPALHALFCLYSARKREVEQETLSLSSRGKMKRQQSISSMASDVSDFASVRRQLIKESYFCTLTLPDESLIMLEATEEMTMVDLLEHVWDKRQLEPREHWIQISSQKYTMDSRIGALAEYAKSLRVTPCAERTIVLEKSGKNGYGFFIRDDEIAEIGSIFISRVLPESPAYEAGLFGGEEILFINGTRVLKMSLNEVSALLKQKSNKCELHVRLSQDQCVMDHTAEIAEKKLQNGHERIDTEVELSPSALNELAQSMVCRRLDGQPTIPLSDNSLNEITISAPTGKLARWDSSHRTDFGLSPSPINVTQRLSAAHKYGIERWNAEHQLLGDHLLRISQSCTEICKMEEMLVPYVVPTTIAMGTLADIKAIERAKDISISRKIDVSVDFPEDVEAIQKVENSSVHHVTDAVVSVDQVVALSLEQKCERLVSAFNKLTKTEAAYIVELEYIENCFMSPLTSDGDFNDLLIDMQVSSIFGNVKDLFEFHCRFCSELTTVVKASCGSCGSISNISDIANLFVYNMNTFNETYSVYCFNYPDALMVLKTLSKNELFENYLRATNPTGDPSLSLLAYLVKPVHRLLEYPVLLHECLALMEFEEEFPGTTEFEVAIKVISAISEYVNKNACQKECINKAEELFSSLEGYDGPNRPSIGPLLHFSSFLHVNIDDMTHVENFVDVVGFVFQEIIILARNHGSGKPFFILSLPHTDDSYGSQYISSSSEDSNYLCIASIDFRKIYARSIRDCENAKNVFKLISHTGDDDGKTIYSLSAYSSKEKDLWMSIVKGLLSDHVLASAGMTANVKTPSAEVPATIQENSGNPKKTRRRHSRSATENPNDSETVKKSKHRSSRRSSHRSSRAEDDPLGKPKKSKRRSSEQSSLQESDDAINNLMNSFNNIPLEPESTIVDDLLKDSDSAKVEIQAEVANVSTVDATASESVKVATSEAVPAQQSKLNKLRKSFSKKSLTKESRRKSEPRAPQLRLGKNEVSDDALRRNSEPTDIEILELSGSKADPNDPIMLNVPIDKEMSKSIEESPPLINDTDDMTAIRQKTGMLIKVKRLFSNANIHENSKRIEVPSR